MSLILSETVWSASQAVAITQDAADLSWSELRSAVGRLASQLLPLRGRRVALTTRRAVDVAAALLAAEQAGTGLLLLRSGQPPFPSDWNVSGSIREGLDVVADARATGSDAGEFELLLTTSGTTGTPKVARHSLTALMGRIRAPRAGDPPARWLLTYHPATFAGLQVLLTSLRSGAHLVASTAGTVADLAEAAQKLLPTHVSGTPTFWRAFVPSLSAEPRRSIRQITLGGEAVDQATIELLRRTFPDAALTHIYASTEAGSLFAVKDGRAGFPAAWLETGVEGARLRVRDGILEVCSPRAMRGYAGTAAAEADRWIATGDLVERRGDRMFFAGRHDTILNVGGAKVAPEEVEAALLELPGIVEARVYGRPSPITGTVLTADIVPQPGADPQELRARVVARLGSSLERHKVPRLINVVESIGLSAAGKKQRDL